jgi:cobalt-zinc-cadmium efflux system membrane fusion protein
MRNNWRLQMRDGGRRRLRGWAPASAAFIAILMICAGCSPGTSEAQSPPAPPAANASLTPDQRQHITLYTVTPSNYRKTIETTGVVDFNADQSTSVLAPISGPVSRLQVSLGQHVNKDEALALVESPDFATAVSTYRKAIATAQTARRLADRDKDLFEHQGVPQREMEQAETDAANAESDRDAALQALVSLDVDPQAIADIQQGKPPARVAGVIRAPIAGTVVERLVTPGQLLSAGTTPCFTIADLSRVWVMAQVFDSDITSIKAGDPAEVMTGVQSGSFAGSIGNIAALVDPNTRSVAVRVVANNPGDVLKKQMYVRVRINSRQQNSGLLVPDSAILRDDENLPFVYLAQPDGSFSRQRVTLGYRVGDRYDIPTGLKPGDRVVTEGGIFVQFMQSQ